MSNLKFAKTHNLVAFLEKPKESDGFEGIIDFLNASSIRYALTREGKGFSGRATPLFETMMVQAQEGGKGSEMPIVPQHTSIINQPSSSQPTKKQKPRKTKKQNTEITKLKKRVKKLERRNKSKTPGLKRLRKVGRTARIESSEDEGLGDQEDASKQGRKITDLDVDAEEVEVKKVVSTVEVTTVSAIPTIVDGLTLAQTLFEIKAAKPKAVTTAATTTTTAVTRPKARG
ncbi:hypothetical protein Tco_0842395, partial [Tanacetum coccineum]